MLVNLNLLAANPFFDAYRESDPLGKMIFIGLVFLSICSWTIIAHKVWLTQKCRKNSASFLAQFHKQKSHPLGIEWNPNKPQKELNPFFEIYMVLKKYTIEILNKNRKFGGQGQESSPSLSQADIDMIDGHLMSKIAYQTKDLDKNLFILSTVVSLGPFLGLLGTVWGILTSFSEMQVQSAANSQAILGGLSLALATTVLGLIDAIPALIGYNYLKNRIQSFETEMEGFSTELLAAVEMQYRQVDQ